MEVLTLFTTETPYREPLPVKGWQFGSPRKRSLAVVGSMRGNELQQTYICARLIQRLEKIEAAGQLDGDCGILVIPCVNQFSMNVKRRFWAADNTDINRMFPGYEGGETTQRIAARLFQVVQDYTYGVQLASFYLPGDFLPHVRIMETGYQRSEEATAFGLPYLILRTPQPYDTTTLNYNLQVWNTQAFSLYTKETDGVDDESAQEAVSSVLCFLYAKGLSHSQDYSAGCETTLFREVSLHTVLSTYGGLLMRRCEPGDTVERGALLAEILDPCTCEVKELLRSDCRGQVFFAHKTQLICGHEVAFRVLPDDRA